MQIIKNSLAWVAVNMATVSLCFGITAEEGKIIFQKARAGDADAQYQMGDCFAKGDGVKADSKQARGWYEKAAAQQHAQAKSALKKMDRPVAKGRVQIANVPPAVSEAKGIELMKIIQPAENYVPVKGKDGLYYTKFKPDAMTKVRQLVKDGADLNLILFQENNVGPYRKADAFHLGAGQCVLAWAAGDRQLVEFLLANGASCRGRICNMVFALSLERIQMYLEVGLDPNDCIDERGRPILLGALLGRNTRGIEMFIEAGADINARVNDWEHSGVRVVKKRF